MKSDDRGYSVAANRQVKIENMKLEMQRGDAYELLAERFSEIAETKAENGYIESPAMRAEIGNVSGLSLLEAGCGPGFLATHM